MSRNRAVAARTFSTNGEKSPVGWAAFACALQRSIANGSEAIVDRLRMGIEIPFLKL
jgi:hypothetical protein